tara:strand:+ start:487 stop:684 length:198 start_codon:yes stop_codon:yes gene_type:complete
MTEDGYTKRLDDIRCWIGSLWESVNDGNVSAKDILEELDGMRSDLAFIIDEFMDLELDELILNNP